MDTAKVTITHLNGTNYLIWSTQVEALLRARGLWKYIDGSNMEVTSASEAKVEQERSSARAAIICTIEPEYISMVAGDQDPKLMWKKLSDSNKSKCVASVHTLRNKLLNITMSQQESVREFVNRICTIERQLSFAGKHIDEDDKKYALLNGVRAEFEVKKTILMESYDVSFEKMVSSLEQTEDQYSKTKCKQASNTNSGSSFAAVQSSTRKFACFICGKEGHRMRECFYNPKSKSYKPSLKRTPQITENLKKRKLTRIDAGSNSKSDGYECQFTFMVQRAEDIHHRWFLDSCASRHLCNSREDFIEYKSLAKNEEVSAACEGASVQVIGIGKVRVSQLVDGNETTTILKNVGHAPNCRTNLISLPVACRAGININFEDYTAKFQAMYNGRKVMVGDCNETGITELTGMSSAKKHNSNVLLFTAGDDDDMELAHRRTCHTSVSTLRKMASTNCVIGLDKLKSTKKVENICESCVEGKATNQPHPRREKTTTRVLQLMHTDLVGEIKPEGLNGERYMQLLTDDFSGGMWVSSLKSKGEAAIGTKNMVLHAQKLTGVKLVSIRPDGAKELKEGASKRFLDENKTIIEDIPPYSPQSNGRAERSNRTVLEKARTILCELNMICTFKNYRSLWPEAVRCVVYVHNRTLTRSSHPSVRDKTPFEILTGRKPDLSNLRVFGSKVKVLRPKPYRGSKFDPKTWNGVHVGYDAGNSYRVFIPEIRRVFVSKDVTFLEKLYRMSNEASNTKDERSSDVEIQCIDDEKDSTDDNTNGDDNADPQKLPWIPDGNESDTEDSSEEFHNASEGTNQDVQNTGIVKTRSGRAVNAPNRFGHLAFLTSETILGNVMDRDPSNVEEAMRSKQKHKWVNAMVDEMKSIASNEVFMVVPKPLDRKIVSCRWVLAKKRNSAGKVYRYKARLVARGFSQVKGIDYTEVFSPVVRYDTLRYLLAKVARENLELYQVDVKTAFLNGDLDEEIYMETPNLPDEVRDEIISNQQCGKLKQLQNLCKERNGNVALRLFKSIYGLKQASMEWHKKLKSVLVKSKFEQGTSDLCLFVCNSKSGNACYILVYVDDILIAGKTKMDCEEVAKILSKEFEISAIDEANFFLGIKIERNRNERSLYISQAAYIEKILKRFNLSDTSSKYPMRVDLDLRRASEEEMKTSEKFPYRELIGSLMYLAVVSRPDIMFAVSRLARYFTCYSHEHWKAAQTVANYVCSTKNCYLCYKGQVENLEGYTDADWAGDKDERKSTSGLVYTVGGTAFMWSSKRQSIVASSSQEAEYIAQSKCIRNALWVRKLLNDFGENVSSINIHADNNGAIALAKDSKMTECSKHINVCYHLCRDYIEKGIVNVSYICSDDMVADCMTKPHGTQKLEISRKMLGLEDTLNKKDAN